MSPDEFQKQFEELTEELYFEVSAEASRLFRSGAVDPDDFGDDMRLPKVLLYVAMHNVAESRRPLSADLKKHVANLRKF